MPTEYLSLGDAAVMMGVSRSKLWRLVRDGVLPAYQSEIDRREKLVRRSDVEALMRPQLIDEADRKKVAA